MRRLGRRLEWAVGWQDNRVHLRIGPDTYILTRGEAHDVADRLHDGAEHNPGSIMTTRRWSE